MNWAMMRHAADVDARCFIASLIRRRQQTWFLMCRIRMKCCRLGDSLLLLLLLLLLRLFIRSSVRLVVAVYVYTFTVSTPPGPGRRYNITAHLSCPIRHFVERSSCWTERDSVVVASPAIIAATGISTSSCWVVSAWVAPPRDRCPQCCVATDYQRTKCFVINDRRPTPFTVSLHSVDRLRVPAQ